MTTTARERVDRIRELAHLHGWGVGEHGTMGRDIDLIAVPWTDDASPMAVLIAAIQQVLKLNLFSTMSRKPCGRWAQLFQVPGTEHVGSSGFKTLWDPPMIDLSFVDPREPSPAEVEA